MRLPLRFGDVENLRCKLRKYLITIMATKTSLTGNLVLEYIRKFPRTANLTLARKLVLDCPSVYSNVEHARRTIIRTRHMLAKTDPEAVSETVIDPSRIPVSHAVQKEPYFIPAKHNRILIISDLHIPYHNVPALTTALQYGLDHKANCILINGDLLDFHHLSRFEKDIRKRRTAEEFDAALEFLKYVRKTFPRAHIVWAEGNHDARYPKFLAARALELWGDDYYTLQARLQLDKLRIEFVEDTRYIMAGKLSISHGHRIIRGIFAPVNAARGVFLRTKESHLIGHTHSVSEHSEKRLHGELVTTWSTGCLCELNPDYDPFVSKAAHGFAFVDVDKTGHYRVTNKRIINGELL